VLVSRAKLATQVRALPQPVLLLVALVLLVPAPRRAHDLPQPSRTPRARPF